MIGTIPRRFIDDLLDRVDIVEIIDHRVKLKKAGKNYTACCPFHDEKTPSFSVSPDKQFYYCFGCGATGNAIGFLMDYERTSFPETVENLAKTVGIDVPREAAGGLKQRDRERARQKARNSLYALMEEANDYYQRQLREHPEKQRPVDYLKRRGFTGQVAKEYNIGFAPSGWENIASALATSNERQSQLLEAGMLVHNEENDRFYDRFRDRIMFPIRDLRGRIVAFGGRVLGNQKPKYLNSPETSIFSKGRELYGLYEARQTHNQLPRLLIVEGYMDVVALAQFGIQYAVATLGTTCSEEHLKQSFRFTNEVVFCFDGDEAGRQAARRAMENALPIMEDGRQIKFLYLPEGEDPDTLIRQVGAEKFTYLIEGATPLESFLFEELGRGINLQTIEGRARLCKLSAPLLDRLPRGVYRELMFQQLANRSELSMDAVMNLLQELPSQTAPTETNQDYTNAGHLSSQKAASKTRLSSDYHSQKVSTHAKNRKELSAAELALCLLLFQPKLAQSFQDLESLRHQKDENIMLLVEIMELLHQRPEYTSGQILGHWQGAYGPQKSEYLQQILAKGVLFQNMNVLSSGREQHNFDTQQEFLDALAHLRKHQQAVEYQSIIQRLNAKPLDTWTEAEKRLYHEAINITCR